MESLKLKRELNLLQAVAVMTGVIIGSGIFVSPVSIIANCGSVGLSLIVWVVTGLLSLCVALCFAELSCLYPKAGGEYQFFKEILGPLPGFLSMWTDFSARNSCFLAILSLTTVNYIIYPAFPDCDLLPAGKTLLSLLVLVTLCAINCVYVRYVTRLQTLFFVLKIGGLLLINAGAVVQFSRGRVDTSVYSFTDTTSNPAMVGIAVCSGVYTYGGWQYMLSLLEETNKPEKVVVPAVYISMALVTLLYLLTNVAYFAVLSPADMIASQAVAVTFSSRVFGVWGTVVMPIMVACSTLGAMNGTILGATRKYFAAARDGLFPSVIATIHVKYSTPWVSIFSSGFVAVVFILVGDVLVLIEYLGFLDVFSYAAGVACVLYLRYKQPKLQRPYKVALWVALVALALLIGASIVAFYEEPYRSGIAILFVFAGIPVYWLGVTWKNKPEWYYTYIRFWFTSVQKALLVAKEDVSP